MKNFLEHRFPEEISTGSMSGLEFFTDVAIGINGHEHRNCNWSKPRMSFCVARTLKNRKQLEDLIAFFRMCQGKARGFRFKDWSDYSAVKQLIGTSDGRNTEFQLMKRYKLDNIVDNRLIYKPVKGTVKLYADHSPMKNSDYTVNYENGRVKLHKILAKGAKIFADFEFDVPVRFDNDQLVTSIEGNNVFVVQDINLVEIKS